MPRCCSRAGIDDWGGVSPADPGPRQPRAPLAARSTSWPRLTAAAGFTLRERLTAHPAYVRAGRAVDRPAGARARRARWPTRTTGLAREGVRPVGPAVAGAGRRRAERRAAIDLHAAIDTDGPRPTTGAATSTAVYGDWDVGRATQVRRPRRPRRRRPSGVDADVRGRRCARAERDPAALLDPARRRCAGAARRADGAGAGRAVPRSPTTLRRDAVGDDVTYVVNRNINFTNVCYIGCRFCAFAQRERRRRRLLAVARARSPTGPRRRWAAGATEVCMQGGIDPELPGHRLRRPGAGGQGAGARACTCTRSRPMEIVNGAPRSRAVRSREWLIELREAGLDTIPGTAAEILDDEVRWVLTKGKLPTPQPGSRSSPPRTSSACGRARR